MWASDFAAFDFGDSWSVLLEKNACRKAKGGRRSMGAACGNRK